MKKIELPDCENCPLSWEEGYEYKDGGCYVNYDINWCRKSFKERQKKADEIELEIAKYWDEMAKVIDECYRTK